MACNRLGGRRSRGCDLCRKRKVRVSHSSFSKLHALQFLGFAFVHMYANNCAQCDEARPTCVKCSRIGKLCSYRDSVDLLFHDETPNAAARAKRLWQARASPVRSVSSPSSGRSSQSSSASPSSVLELTLDSPRSLSPSREQVAIQRFNFDFVIEPNGCLGSTGHLEFVPALYSACEQGSSLELAVEAVAFANLSRRGHAAHISKLATRKYVEAMRLTGVALNDFKTMTTDETLVSCHLLSLYEVRISTLSHMALLSRRQIRLTCTPL